MTWVLIATGLGGAAMLAAGCNLIVPLGGGIAGLCDLTGLACVITFCSLMDGR